VRGPDLSGQLGAAQEQWEAIQGEWRAWQRYEEDLKGCAGEMERAQLGFVPFGLRLGIAAATAVALSLVSLSVFSAFLEFWPHLAAIGIGAGLGCLLGAVVPHLLERRAGIRALACFKGLLGQVPKNAETVNQECQEAVCRAFTYWERLRARAGTLRLGLLLRRAQAILDRELQPEPPLLELEDGGLGADEDALSTEQRRQRMRRQRAAFRRRSRLALPVKGRVEDLDLDGFHERFIERFRELWRELGRRDKATAGHLPASELIPMLRDLIRGHRSDLEMKIHQEALRNLRGDAKSVLLESLRGLGGEGFYHLLSCPAAAHEVDAREFGRSLVVPASAPEAGLLEAAREDGIRNVLATPCLDEAPCMGILVEEAPVRLGEGEQGLIEVRDYAAD
jgi:hypothetical protein